MDEELKESLLNLLLVFFGVLIGMLLMALIVPESVEQDSLESPFKDKKLYWSEYNLAGNPYVTCNELVYIEGHRIYCSSNSFNNQDYNITLEIPQLYDCKIQSSLLSDSDKKVEKHG